MISMPPAAAATAKQAKAQSRLSAKVARCSGTTIPSRLKQRASRKSAPLVESSQLVAVGRRKKAKPTLLENLQPPYGARHHGWVVNPDDYWPDRDTQQTQSQDVVVDQQAQQTSHVRTKKYVGQEKAGRWSVLIQKKPEKEMQDNVPDILQEMRQDVVQEKREDAVADQQKSHARKRGPRMGLASSAKI